MAEKSISKNAFYSFMKAFVSFAIPLIAFPYASRILLPEGIGKNNFSLSIIYYFTSISTLGIVNYGTREASKLKNDKIQLSLFCKEILSINLVSILFSYTVFFIILFKVPKLYEYRSILLVFSTLILFGPLSMDWLYNALEEFKYVTIRQFIFQIIALVYLFIFVRTKENTLEYAIYGAISGTGSCICNFIHSRKFIDLRVKGKLQITRHLKYVFTFFGMSLVTSIYQYLDSTILGFLSTDTQVGFYSSASKISNMCVSLLSATTLVLLPRLSIYMKENKTEDFIKLCKKSLCLIILISIPMVFGVISLSKQIILLFSGVDYLPAITSMYFISPVIFVISISFLTGTQIIPALGKEKISLISYITGASSNFLLNILLIPKYGAAGAAFATLIAEFTIMLIQVIYVRKYIFSIDFIITLLQAIISSAIFFFCIKLFNKYVSQLLLQVFGSIFIGISLYFLLLLLFRNKYLLEIISILRTKIKEKIR